MIPDTILVLIINNSFLLAAAIAKYLADSNCTKFLCCGAIEIDDLQHINTSNKKDADVIIDSMTSTIQHPVTIGENK